MIVRHKIGLGLATLFSAVLVVPVLADGASDFQANTRKASSTLDEISKLVDNVHSRVAAGGGSAGPVADTGGAPRPGAGGGGRQQAQTLFAASCRCHTVGNAPKLTHVGADATHTATWIAEYAANPKSKNPAARMPPQRNIAARDLRRISNYLASLK